MKPTSFTYRKLILNLVVVFAGAVILGTLNKLMGNLLLPGAEFISLRPQLIIPTTASLLVGPWVGGLIGLLGNGFGDLLLDYGFRFWPWSIANFLIGFFPGIVRWMGVKDITTIKEFALVLLFIFLGNICGLFEGFLVYSSVNGQNFTEIINSFYLPAVISNVYLLLLLMPPALILVRFLKLNIETRSMFFVLLFSLIIVTLLSGAFIIAEYQVNLDSNNAQVHINSTIEKLFRWIGIMLIIIVFAGGIFGYYFSKRYMQPINQLAGISNKLKNGSWNKTDIIAPGKAGSETYNLISIFNDMAFEIKLREQKMQNTIRELELRIDKEKEDQIVAEITETDFFKSLEKKSAALKKTKK